MDLQNYPQPCDADLEQQVSAYYAPELPYHNFSHALKAVANGREIVAACQREGIPVDAGVVYYALLFHDAGFIENPRRHDCDTREAYSAFIADKLLSGAGLSREKIEAVKAAIISTTREAEFTTPEQQAVRAADLFDMAADYELFRSNTDKLRQEYVMLTGQPVTEAEWRRQVGEVIGFYLGQEIGLTAYFRPQAGQASEFNQGVARNLQRYLGEAGAVPANG